MKLEIPTKTLTAAVRSALPHTTTEVHLPARSRLLLTASDDGLTILASKDTSSRQERVDCTVQEHGAVALSGKSLLSILAAARGDVTRLSVDAVSHWATLKIGRSQTKIAGVPAGDYPTVVSPPPDAERYELDGEALARALDRVLYAASKEEARINIHGVFMDSDTDGEAAAVSTDGHRLAAYKGESGLWPLPSGLLSLKGAQRLHAELNGPCTARYKPGVPYVFVSVSDDVWLSVRLVPATYPPWRQLLPSTHDGALQATRAELIAAVREVSLSSPAETTFGQLTIGDKVAIRAKTEKGEAVTDVDITVDGRPPSKIFTSLRYLAESIEHANGDDVEIQMRGPLDAMVVRDGPYHGLVMPMKDRGGTYG